MVLLLFLIFILDASLSLLCLWLFLFGSTISNDKARETSLSTTPSNLLLFQGGTSAVGPQCHVFLISGPEVINFFSWHEIFLPLK